VKLGNAAALIQLCPWYMKQFEGKEFVYITRNALLNAAKALPPPLSDRPQIEYFALLNHPIVLHEVCITASPALTKADHDFEVHLLILLPLSNT
jgi:hypothetical protein